MLPRKFGFPPAFLFCFLPRCCCVLCCSCFGCFFGRLPPKLFCQFAPPVFLALGVCCIISLLSSVVNATGFLAPASTNTILLQLVVKSCFSESTYTGGQTPTAMASEREREQRERERKHLTASSLFSLIFPG